MTTDDGVDGNGSKTKMPDESTQLLSRTAPGPRSHRSRLSLLQAEDAEAMSTASRPPYYSEVQSRRARIGSTSGLTSADKQLAVNDYTAVDVLHDLVKDSIRLRSKPFRHGLRGALTLAWDAANSWFAVFLMGALTASVAFLVDISVVTVSGWKMGYCRTGWWKGKAACCAAAPYSLNAVVGEWCDDWIYWTNDFTSQYVIYVACCLVFGLISGSLTYLTKRNLPTAGSSRTDSSMSYQNGTASGTDGHDRASKKIERVKGKIIYRAAGSGIPEIKTIISGFDIPGYLNIEVLVVKAVGSIFAVSTGMCLGKEGPFVHISTCVANLVASLSSKYRNNGGKYREALSAGCAAGMCVAFGAPIGGVLFSLEEICTRFPRRVLLRAFLCSLTAAAVLKYLNPMGTGKLVLFETQYGIIYASHHYLVFAGLGIAGGIFGGIFCRLFFLWSRSFRSRDIIKNRPIFEVGIVVLATALTQFPNVVLREPGDMIIESLLTDCRSEENMKAWVCVHEHGPPSGKMMYMGWLVYGMVIKLLLSIITFGIKVPSGIIIPALNAGAFFGRLVGQWTLITGTLQPGIFAMVGAVSFLAGVCRMTVSLAVIMFELTGEAEYVIPHMIGILVAKWVADAIEPEGVYELAQILLGHPFLDGNAALETSRNEDGLVDELIPSEQNMADIIVDVPSSGLLSVQLVRKHLEKLKDTGPRDPGLVLVREGILLGYLTESEFETGLRKGSAADAADTHTLASKTCRVAGGLSGYSMLEHSDVDLVPFVNRAPLMVTRGAPMEHGVELFSKLGLAYLLVVEEGSGQIYGVIFRKHLLDWLHEKKFRSKH